jgi:hypothetical protein
MSATIEQVMAALDARDAAGAAGPQGEPAAPLASAGAAVAAPAPHRQAAVLQRWQAVAGDAPMPEPGQLNVTQGMQLQAADPELYAVLSGQPLPASLEIALLSGTFPAEQPAPPSPEQQRAAVVQALTQGGTVNPYLPGGSLSAQLQLAQADPAVAEQLRLAAFPAIQALQQQQAAAEQQRQAEQQEAANEAARANQIAAARQHFGLD